MVLCSGWLDGTYIDRVERNNLNITLKTLEKIITGLSMDDTDFFSFLALENQLGWGENKPYQNIFNEINFNLYVKRNQYMIISGSSLNKKIVSSA